MSEPEDAIHVRIVELAPMRVAALRAEGAAPEMHAMAKLLAWARPHGLLADPDAWPVFGFNDPDPSPGVDTYGYRFWIRVPDDLPVDGEARIEHFAGGLYAVTTCDPGDEPGRTIPSAWKALHRWIAASAYEPGPHRWLERHRFPRGKGGTLTVDLYAPIREAGA